MKCEKCGYEIPEDKPLKIIGDATIEGYTTLDQFYKEGVEWHPRDSRNECFVCPNCNKRSGLIDQKGEPQLL